MNDLKRQVVEIAEETLVGIVAVVSIIIILSPFGLLFYFLAKYAM